MPVPSMTLVERMARVLAARALSSSADGADPSAADRIAESWQDFVEDAVSILRTMREPDPVMAKAGDAEMWGRMVDAALEAERLEI